MMHPTIHCILLYICQPLDEAFAFHLIHFHSVLKSLKFSNGTIIERNNRDFESLFPVT